MKHPSVRQLFDYWNERRGLRSAPDRADIDPGAIRRVLADTFVLAFDAGAGHPFRIAGTRVCAAFGREQKGKAFVELWRLQDRAQMRDLLKVVAYESVPVVLSARAANEDGDELEFEVLVLPLKHRGRLDARLLGAAAPAAMPYWFGVKPVGPLALGSYRYLGAVTDTDPLPRLAPAAPQGRRSHGFVVYDGGRLVSEKHD